MLTLINEDFLDTIALLSAHFKPRPNATGERDSDAQHQFLSRHVTATGMRKAENLVTIYIAKNGGPQDFNGKGDREFADFLQKWLNSRRKSMDKGLLQKWTPHLIIEDEDFEDYIGVWWSSRLDYYEHQIKSKWCPQEFTEVSKYSQTHHDGKVDIKNFTSDWNDVKDLILQSTSSGTSVRECLLRSSGTYQDIDRQNYPRVAGSHCPAAQRFRKVIKSSGFLHTIRRALRTCRCFRDSLRGQTVEVEYEPFKKPMNLPKERIIQKFESLVHEPRLASPVKRNLQQAISEIKKQRSLKGRFHCELQMLKKLHAQNDVVDYFGCSKRSCFFCWEILRGTQFITRDTHNKLYYKWFVPFTGGNLAPSLKQVAKLLSTRFSTLIEQPRQPPSILMSETESLATIRSREFQADSSGEPIPASLAKYTNLEACDFRTLQIPPSGEPKMCSYRAFNLRTSAGILSDFQAIVSVYAEYGIEAD